MNSVIRVLRPLYRFFWGLPGRRTLARVARQRPCRIVVGASATHDEGWIPTEVSFLDITRPSHWARYFPEDWIDAILAEHVWEHLTPPQAEQGARLCFRYLCPGGHMRVAVPDGLHPDPLYRERVRPGGSTAAARDHQVLYTYRTLSRVFAAASFAVRLLEHFDEEGAFHTAPWDPAQGRIRRSARFDKRNRAGTLKYTSIILDAVKPDPPAT